MMKERTKLAGAIALIIILTSLYVYMAIAVPEDSSPGYCGESCSEDCDGTGRQLCLGECQDGCKQQRFQDCLEGEGFRGQSRARQRLNQRSCLTN